MRRPVQISVGGESVEMLTIGYLIRATGKSRSTLLTWERLGILPATPFRYLPDRPEANKRAYPQSFVAAMRTIVTQPYMLTGLKRTDWDRFHREVSLALDAAIGELRAVN